jgi:hypothetical protein
MQKLIPTPCYHQNVFHIFLSRLAKLCPNNFFKPASVAVEAIVLFVLLCTLTQTGEIILKSKTASDIQLLEIKTLIEKFLYFGDKAHFTFWH